ncbi:MAG: hypothetical protein AAGE65_11490 [Planctomycetota bacterium]
MSKDWEKRCTDLVMRGGVTSGIVYPPAIRRIAEEFTLIGIGGTSAGAMAAAIAAAAEFYRRKAGSIEGFEHLARLPDDLSEDGRMVGLFRPDASTAKLHARLMRWMDRKQSGKEMSWAYFLKQVPGLWWQRKSILRNNYGLCSGMAVGNPAGANNILPLTHWLHEQIQTAAGLDLDRPLTFADLHGARVPEPLRPMMGDIPDRAIDLRMVTTCLTYGRPLELPCDTNRFAFDPDEWARLFPEEVVDYLINEARSNGSFGRWQEQGKVPISLGASLPVIVATRMSLSFPLMFSMVPLYAINYEESNVSMIRVWLSDGGITSNFPIHSFDSLFPRWPTMGLNLMYTGADRNPASKGARMSYIGLSKQRGGDWFGLPTDFLRDPSEATPIDLINLLKDGIFRSAQNWHDNAYLQLDMFRDRVAEIWLTPEQGGFNLTMPRQAIEDLVRRGEKAASALCDRFRDRISNDALSWDGHRWARYRATMPALATALQGFRNSVDHPGLDEKTLAELLDAAAEAPCYRVAGKKQADAMRSVTEDLMRFIATMNESGVCHRASDEPFCGGPSPNARFGVRVTF